MTQVRIHLFGGPCDGERIPVKTIDQPKILYQMWPGYTDALKTISDAQARQEKRESLQTLAYRYVGHACSQDDGVLELHYHRFPKRDLPAATTSSSL